MKKLVLALMLVSFGAAVQAGDAAPANNEKPACCAKSSETKVSKTTCPYADQAACKAGAAKNTVAKQQVSSPKGAEQKSKS